MKRTLVLNDSRFPRLVVCDITTPELRAAGYLRMFELLKKAEVFRTPDLMDIVESQLFGQASNGNAKAALAFLLLVQYGGLVEVDVESVATTKAVGTHLRCPEDQPNA